MATQNLADIKKEIDTVIDEATSLADLAEKFAGIAQRFGGLIPGSTGPEIVAVAGLIDVGDKFLHTLKNLLG